MADLPSILSQATTTSTALGNFVLVTPEVNLGVQPQSGIAGVSTAPDLKPLVFDYMGEDTVTLASDITDHYVEDNTSVSDHIAVKPEVVTVSGFIAELNDIVPEDLEPLKTAATKLTVINAYTPALSATAILAYNQATFAYQIAVNAANAAVQSWSTVKNQVAGGAAADPQAPVQTKQQIIYAQLQGYWRKKTLFRVQTPWQIFDNMAIQSLRAIQDADTRMISNFEITFKKIYFVNVREFANVQAVIEARGAAQKAELRDYGVSGLTTPANTPSAADSITRTAAGGN